jgi:hypothetical protein
MTDSWTFPFPCARGDDLPMDVDRRLGEPGIELPEPMGPGGDSVPAMAAGDLLFCPARGPSGRTAAW